ncbi:MAG: signal recognition particle-docking protein FtsY [Dehalococcoidia bacterium]|jgi:fused signal recognition particle receptor|nr:signal recognition particle-docking protein FtsY [Dehalococcoidia bacterium]
MKNRSAPARVDEGLSKTRGAWFGKVARLFTEPKIEPELWDDLEDALIGSDVGIDLSEELIQRTRDRIRKEGLARSTQVRDVLVDELATILQGSVDHPTETPRSAKPEIILVVGVNGSGKTTTIAKIARSHLQADRTVLLTAADTFRAAAIEQLQHWGQRLKVDVIAHQSGADPGAVVFDSVRAAEARGVDVLIVDTAGRLHTKSNLMEELKKIRRVITRALPEALVRVLLVLDATTGQNGLLQAREFLKTVDVDELVLSKLDGTSKGGIALAVARELAIPITYVGFGEGIDDLAEFDPVSFASALVG